MKNILLVAVLMLLHSCSLHKPNGETSSNDGDLSETEKTIVNDFLDVELKKERYISYKDFEIVIIEEALITMKSINSYQYSLNDWKSMNKVKKIDDMNNLFFLDSLQLKKIKMKLEREPIYHWKVSDFKNLNVSLLKYGLFREKINSNKKMFEKSGFLIFLSRPLIIDQNNAFISFDFSNCNYLCNGINHLTILMRKVNNKWVENGYYEDGVFN